VLCILKPECPTKAICTIREKLNVLNKALMKRTLALLLVLVIAEPGWPVQPTVTPELPDPGSVSMSKEQQIQLGLKTAAEVYKQMPVMPDSDPVSQYVQQLGKKLEAVIPPEHTWPYQFHVIQQRDINAFALPGGQIFVNIGTINAADNEAELAGVMAHEMSHVYMQHSAKQAPKQEWAGILGALGGLLGGSAGSLARMGIQLGAGTLLMKYSRHDEAQADAVGAIIMYKAGFDPKAMAEFFQKLEKQGGGSGPQFLSDHPNPGNRVEAVSREIANWPPKTYLPTSQAFIRAKQEASGIKAYTAQQIADGAQHGLWARENAKSGAIPANVPVDPSDPSGQTVGGALTDVSFEQVKPSDTFKRLDHDLFSISYPANWQALSGRNSVTLAPPAGLAQGAIAYGVVIGATQDANAGSLDEATQSLAQSLQQSNPGLQVSGNVERIQVNGTQGRSLNFTGQSPVQQNGRALPERDWLVTVPRPGGGLLYLVFIAPERDVSLLRPTYLRMLDSLQVR
jgi:Zn-dependent protease with chaperone function